MRFFVGVTDFDWFRFLAGRPDIDELNFWQPSADTAVRITSIGCDDAGSCSSTAFTAAGTPRNAISLAL